MPRAAMARFLPTRGAVTVGWLLLPTLPRSLQLVPPHYSLLRISPAPPKFCVLIGMFHQLPLSRRSAVSLGVLPPCVVDG